MKKILLALGMAALLAGCASRDNENGMGGTSDQSNESMKTDTYNNNNNNGTSQFNNNATHGTGTEAATNSATGSGM
jgi:hypothetical protein